MKTKVAFYYFMTLAVFLTCGLYPAVAQENKKFKVLVVMSYEEDYNWVQDIKKGIDSVMDKTCDLKYFYMDTKKNPAGGEQKAKEAYALYQEFQPDGVITADDNAQSMFVVPYLKDKVKTPVMFSGVNAEPEKYGYPASNVSGILERPHITESIAFLDKLTSLKTIGFIGKDDSTTKEISEYIRRNADACPIKFLAFSLVKTMDEAVKSIKELREQCESLYIANMEGLPGEDGKSLTKKEIIPVLVKMFNKPTITDNSKDIKYGILCSVAVTGQEQGETAAEMLLKAMQGTPISQLPITRNYYGKRMINVNMLKTLGIRPKPEIINSSELVRTEE